MRDHSPRRVQNASSPVLSPQTAGSSPQHKGRKQYSTTTTTKQENRDSRLVRACTHAHQAAQHIRHRPNCVPPGVRSSRRRHRRRRCRRAPWQCGGGGENLVVSAFGLSPGGADVKSGSVERALGEKKAKNARHAVSHTAQPKGRLLARPPL